MFIKDVIYRLKHLYGVPITLCKEVSVSIDTTSGIEVKTTTIKPVARAILLPAKLTQEIVQKSGIFDPTKRNILIDNIDLSSFKIETEDYIIFENRHWHVIEVTYYAHLEAYFLIVKDTQNDTTSIPLAFEDEIILEEEVEYEL